MDRQSVKNQPTTRMEGKNSADFRGKRRSRKKKQPGIMFWTAMGVGTTGIVAALVLAAVMLTGRQYENRFFPNTVINGIDVSKKTVDEVERLISAGIEGYLLTVEERGGVKEQISGMAINLEAVFDGSLESLLEEQEPNEWWKYRRTRREFQIDAMIQYDDKKLEDAVSNLACFDEEQVKKPEDAYLSDYLPGRGYAIVPAEEGNALNGDIARQAIADAVAGLKDTVSLEEADAYEKPSVPTDDPLLVSRLEKMNRYVAVSVTHTFGDRREVLDGDTISGWLETGEAGEIYVSSKAVTDYVKELASKYDTYNRAKLLKTSYGETVRITGGSYGWRIDQAAEADELAAILKSGESQVREPVYKQRAASHGANDYGDTYVEINLTAQHLFYYKDGKKIIESDFVSGNESKGWATPAGVYPLTYKERNATLKGENYRTPVDYWMPFNGNIGMHDATWRNSFGGNLYKTGGSHGCVNLPHGVAKMIYENISSQTPVLCYHLDGTQSTAVSNAAGEVKPSETETTAAPTVTLETPGSGQEQPSETQPGAGQVQPSETAPGSGGQNQPSGTAAPGDGQSQPSGTAAPGDGQNQPSGTAAPGDGQSQPSGTAAPGDGQSQPSGTASESSQAAEASTAASQENQKSQERGPGIPSQGREKEIGPGMR